MTADEKWTAQQCADHIGVKLSTWHAYVRRPTRTHPAPEPVDHVGATPRWSADEVRTWHATRPGSPIPRS